MKSLGREESISQDIFGMPGLFISKLKQVAWRNIRSTFVFLAIFRLSEKISVGSVSYDGHSSGRTLDSQLMGSAGSGFSLISAIILPEVCATRSTFIDEVASFPDLCLLTLMIPFLLSFTR